MIVRATGVLILATVLPSAAIADGPYTILFGDQLCEIDISNGSIDVIGTISTEAHCLAFHVDGFLYGVNFYDNVLVRLDPATGASTVVGYLGVEVDDDLGVDCTVDDSGQMWFLDHRSLYSVDTSTGAATRVCEQSNPDVHLIGLEAAAGSMITAVEWPWTPVDLDCGLVEMGPRGDCIQWIDSGADSSLYGIKLSCSPWTWECDSLVYRVDSATGSAELLITFEDLKLVGFAFPPQKQQPAAVPASSRLSILLLAGLFGLTGVMFLRFHSVGSV